MPSASPWDDEKFDRFVAAIVRMARGEMAGYGMPHVVFPYEPQMEQTCIERVSSLRARLSPHGLASHPISVAALIARFTRRWSESPLRDAGAYRRLAGDLANLTNGVVPNTAKLCAAEIRDQWPEDH